MNNDYKIFEITYNNNDTFNGYIDEQNKTIIKGNYKNNKLNHEYIGEFLNNKLNGKCTLKLSDEYIVDGYFIDNKVDINKKVKIEKYIKNNKIIYNGYVDNDLKKVKEGNLKIYNCDTLETEYSGNFLNDMFDGLGDLRINNNDISIDYKGSFKNNEYNGYGCLSYYNNSLKYNIILEGKFINNKITGNFKGSLVIIDDNIDYNIEGYRDNNNLTYNKIILSNSLTKYIIKNIAENEYKFKFYNLKIKDSYVKGVIKDTKNIELWVISGNNIKAKIEDPELIQRNTIIIQLWNKFCNNTYSISLYPTIDYTFIK